MHRRETNKKTTRIHINNFLRGEAAPAHAMRVKRVELFLVFQKERKEEKKLYKIATNWTDEWQE